MSANKKDAIESAAVEFPTTAERYPAAPDWLNILRLVLLSRKIDQLEVEQLAPAGHTKLQISAAGHELPQVLLGLSLCHRNDAATVYYRSRPLMLASGLTATEAISASIAHSNSPSEGRDVGVIFNMPRRSGATILPASGDVGSQFTPAAGWAQAIRYRTDVLRDGSWEGAVAVATGGDGSVATNGFWAALNLATTMHLPLLFFIEDNGHAISVPSQMQTPGGDITENLASFQNLKIVSASGSKPLETWQAISTAVDHIRRGGGPCLLRLEVPRLAGHAYHDAQSYKSPEQIAEEAALDPLCQLKDYLLSRDIISPQKLNELSREIEHDIERAYQSAQRSKEPEPDEATRHLYFEHPPAQGGLRPENALVSAGKSVACKDGELVDLREAIRRTLDTELDLNPRMLVFGEDVARYGGIHGVTRGLMSKHGEDRVFDTSLSEEGIIGRAMGMAINGLLPVPEIQFRKYADAAQQQLIDIGTVRWRTAGKFANPMVVRMPVGYAKKYGDPWHSMTGESIYAHMLGWRIAFPSSAADAAGLLRTALRGDDPTFFLEHRGLLVASNNSRPYPGDEYVLPFGKAATLTEGTDLTVVTWGGMVDRCVEAAVAFSGRVTVLDLRTIMPWDETAVVESVRQTGRLLVVQEDSLTAGFAAEIIACVASQVFKELKAPLERLASLDCPQPYNVRLLNRVVPNVDAIRSRIERMLCHGNL